MKSFTSLIDAVRDRLQVGVAVLAAEIDGKQTLLCIVTDDLREVWGLRADVILKQVAAVAGGRGGGKAHLAQAGIPDPSLVPAALASVAPTVAKMIEAHER
jgi:alanyl-tRNA synthetase